MSPAENSISDCEVTVVMPCLDEAETLAVCIRKAKQGLADAGVTGEVLIADNGSTDGSQQIAVDEGARVVNISTRGYGSALRGGILAARGKWIVMGDADDSYDFSKLKPFVERLRNGYDLVMGCRMPRGGGTVLPGAMPWKHRWIGNPVLSFIGRLFFECPANDFHCGLRAFTKDFFEKIVPRTSGMEFASEMVIKATISGAKISEVPITLHPDGRSRPPHLRSWRDGWRHLRFMLLFSPKWLFLVPGIFVSLFGAGGLAMLAVGQLKFGRAVLDVGTMMMFAMLLLSGSQLLIFAIFSRVYAVQQGLLPKSAKLSRFQKLFSLEWGLGGGMLSIVIGFTLILKAYMGWQSAGFQGLAYSDNLRGIIPATTLIILGSQVLFGSFLLGVLGLNTASD